MLLTAALTTQRLNDTAFSHDELRSVIVVGGDPCGPLAWPHGVWRRVYDQSPEQALGFPMLTWGWGRLVGWTELATRTFAYLCGMLTVAVTYRVGCDLFNPTVGAVAALVLATSVVYLALMVKYRVFTLASLAVAVTLRQYVRLLFAAGSATTITRLLFMLGLLGLMYTHYFVTPFVVVIGSFHLIWGRRLAPRSGVLTMMVVGALLFLPQVPTLLRGLTETQQDDALNAAALGGKALFGVLVQTFSNGVPSLLIGLISLAAWAWVMPPQVLWPVPHGRYRIGLVWWCFGVMLVAIAVLNAIAEVITQDRARYLIGLWEPLALLVGIGSWKIASLAVTRSWR